MSIEAVAGAAAGAAAAPSVVQMGYAANLGDVTGFQNALAAAQPAQTAPPTAGADAADAITPALRGMFNALERVNGEAKEVADRVADLAAAGITEVIYQPCGSDIPGELQRFRDAVAQ